MQQTRRPRSAKTKAGFRVRGSSFELEGYLPSNTVRGSFAQKTPQSLRADVTSQLKAFAKAEGRSECRRGRHRRGA